MQRNEKLENRILELNLPPDISKLLREFYELGASDANQAVIEFLRQDLELSSNVLMFPGVDRSA